MKKKPFVHLHVHTCFSLLDGACQIERLMGAVAEQEMPAVAMTDHGVMYGAVDFFQAAQKKGIKPILGCELYVTPGKRQERGDAAREHGNFHLVALAADTAGYYNLVKLVSLAHLEGLYYKPRVDHELLAAHSRGLIGLSACLKGEVAARLEQNDMEGAVRMAGRYSEIFGKGNFYLEVMDHHLPEQRKVNRLMPDLARRTGLPMVATNDVHYLKQEHARAHEILLCMQTGTVMSDAKRMRYESDEFYLRTREEMDELFAGIPGVVDATLDVADRCGLEIEFGKLHFPTFQVPPGTTQKQHLRDLTVEGVRAKYGIRDPAGPANAREREILERMDMELGVIDRTGFINYFLVVWDFMHFARKNGIPVGPGRGSGAGSLVAYALGITAIDPLHYDLIFERFLNPERVSPPDFDIDFCVERRGEVIDYVKRKYGDESVAQIITFGSLGAKTVIRDVGRVLEIPFAKCDRLSKMIPEDPKITLEKALAESPDFKAARDTDEECRRILEYAFVLEGLYRNPGTHAAGVVIGDRPLIEIVPLAVDKEKQRITQYSMNPISAIGLLKMDFLGLKNLTTLQEAVDLVRKLRGVDLDLENIPLDDRKTYELLSRGDTVGVFQLESGGMRDLIRRVSMNRIEDLIAMIALYRPGPMNMLPDYVDRKSGKTPVKYDHPLLEPILRETYGVMVYQEQVQRAANVLAGYSLGKADELRRAMGKKDPEKMAKQRVIFVNGCKEKNSIPADLAGRIFDNMEKFAGYGFNKAHSACYAIVSYRTAYMKANYPAEYMSALLSGEIGNSEKIPVFIEEAQEMGLQVLPPDVNRSAVRFAPEGEGAVRFGLAGIKNVGTGAAEAIVREREAGGPFNSLVALCSRVDSQLANKKVLESLARSGALDAFGMHRARIFGGIDFAMARSASAARDRQSGQASLFGLMDSGPGAAAPADEIPECPPWHPNELLAGERELLGMYMTGHPLTQYAWLIERYQLAGVKGLAALEDHVQTRIGGIISKLLKRVTKTSKENMAILTLEDLDGSVEVLVFPEAYQRYAAEIQPDAAVLVCGEVSRRDEQPKLVAQEIHRLTDAPRVFTRRVSVHLPAAALDDARLQRVLDIVRAHPGLVPLVICLIFPGGERVFVEADKACRVLPSHALVQAIEQELGENSIYVAVKPEAYSRPPPARKQWNNGGGRG